MRLWGGTCVCGHSKDNHGLPGPGDIVYGGKCYQYGSMSLGSCDCIEYRDMDAFVLQIDGDDKAVSRAAYLEAHE